MMDMEARVGELDHVYHSFGGKIININAAVRPT